MDIGQPQREIIVEPLELPEPLREEPRPEREEPRPEREEPRPERGPMRQPEQEPAHV